MQWASLATRPPRGIGCCLTQVMWVHHAGHETASKAGKCNATGKCSATMTRLARPAGRPLTVSSDSFSGSMPGGSCCMGAGRPASKGADAGRPCAGEKTREAQATVQACKRLGRHVCWSASPQPPICLPQATHPRCQAAPPVWRTPGRPAGRGLRGGAGSRRSRCRPWPPRCAWAPSTSAGE